MRIEPILPQDTHQRSEAASELKNNELNKFTADQLYTLEQRRKQEAQAQQQVQETNEQAMVDPDEQRKKEQDPNGKKKSKKQLLEHPKNSAGQKPSNTFLGGQFFNTIA
jgi:hypothetical protein